MKVNTKKLTEAAMLVALAAVLNLVAVPVGAYGGSITLVAMSPIIILSLRNGVKWGLLGGLAYSLIQMMSGGVAPPTQTVLLYFGVVMLDYILPFTVLGLAKIFAFGKGAAKPVVATICVTVLRFVCHVISGVLIWYMYAGDLTPLAYSLLYNASYMVPELILTSIAVPLLIKKITKLESKAYA